MSDKRLRIISGSRKGKKLISVPGLKTRPTSDRIKESIFNILSPLAPNTIVLDLFAGTGAMAIEALSRGVEYAVMLDKDKAAVNVIRKNILACDFSNRAKVLSWDVEVNLSCLIRMQKKFNIIFIDPPYNQNVILPTLGNLVKTNTLAGGALLVIEHSTDESLSPLPDHFLLKDERRYGKTLVSFLNYMI